MAAYAALVSLEHIINNLELHCRPPITLHKEQAHLLTEKVTFLQEFLQLYNPNLPYTKEADPLESRIARAAYTAEDAIESHILDQFSDNAEKMSSDGLYGALEKVIEDMALIEKEAMEIKETEGFKNQLHAKSTPPDFSRPTSSSPIAQKKSVMVGADDLLLELKDKLTTDARDLQTIPIVGMGGSGKTTLALSIYEDGLIKEHFHTCAWVTISQEYNTRQILLQLLTQLINEQKKELTEGELGEMLHKHLFSKRFMIILDDVWSIKAWDGVKRFLPNNKKGSRIVITTRLTTLASALPNSNSLGMTLLNDDDSWDLLSKVVFGEKGCCPPKFEDIGKKIGKSCKGLPLSIVVVGGLLAKSEQTIEFWENMEENLNAIVNLDDDERCLKTLYMSYKQLPVHLKPCFLYMGIYDEDHMICISNLIKMWVAEGFLTPVSGKRPEDVAKVYLKELIDRNLILIHKLGDTESFKYCKVHDLLRDFCLRESKKEGFYTIYPGKEIGNRVTRVVTCGTNTIPEIEMEDALSSLILENDHYQSLSSRNGLLRKMRISNSIFVSGQFIRNEHLLVNSRFFTFTVEFGEFPSLIWQFWNLHTLVVCWMKIGSSTTAPRDFWHMSHIRHLDIQNLYLPDPPPGVEDGIVLANLQTLASIRDFICSEQVVKRIPNVRKLRIVYENENEGDYDRFCLANLGCLDKLKSLDCYFQQLKCQINYPQSLKKLTIGVDNSQCWQDTMDKIGALPLLHKFKLYGGTFKKGEWETSEGQFRSLKSLSLLWCEGLQVWTSEASHFPRLEELDLNGVSELEEISLDFADISTLREIDLEKCNDSTIESARRILEEQEALYGEEETTLKIRVWLSRDNDPALESLRSPNFHVTFR